MHISIEEESNMANDKGISSFSLLLLMAVTALVGLACFSQLKVQYAPTAQGNEVTVFFSYPGASPRIIESEVTSKIEAALATIANCTDICSQSRDGYGYVMLYVGKTANADAVRFEVASMIRNLWTSLPDGCSFPIILLNGGDGEYSTTTAIAFNILSSLPSQEIAKFVNDNLIHSLSTIEGVDGVSIYGDTPYEWVITFDAEQTSILGIDAAHIASAVMSYYGEDILGMTRSGGNSYAVKLRMERDASNDSFSTIPICNAGGRIVRLGDIATFRYQESIPTSYYRVNGLNTLELTISAAQDANLLDVANRVKRKIQELSNGFPEEMSVSISYDSSEYIRDELDKIYLRTGLCLLILLLFVLLGYHSWRYVIVMTLTLTVNILISVVLYYLTGLNIHIYTLAGITVSLGIIIDNSIIMIDHWTRYRNRSVFPAMFSAVLTTVAALLIVLLLPEKEKENLVDFTYVIVINLCVSLAVAYLFVPALLDYLPITIKKASYIPIKRLKRIVKWNKHYEQYIYWGMAHRWVLIVAFIVAFGIPTCLLPDDIIENKEDDNIVETVLSRILRWPTYSDNRYKIDKVIGSSFALFNDAMDRSDFYREPGRESLSINASMPEGCTVQQLNEVMRSMENYLAHFDAIETFETAIPSARDGNITVFFTPDSEETMAPYRIKSEIITMATNLGGANWSITGLDDNYFNNTIVTDTRSEGITLTGYNFDALISYGETLIKWLDTKRRVRDAEIWGGRDFDNPETEFMINYDFGAMSVQGLSPYSYYGSLRSPLFSENIMHMKNADEYASVRIESSKKTVFDAWHIINEAIDVGNHKMKLSEIGSIEKHKSGFPIQRENQSYVISVRYNFIGSPKLAEKLREEAIDFMNDEILPIGYEADDGNYRWFYENKDKYAGLILLVIAIIFFICAVHFNSIRYSLSITWMIPISFIGVFLMFGLSDFTFDKGGVAAFVMLSGITVNAGIYLVSAWMDERNRQNPVECYIRAFDKKIRPIFLTVLSTVLGLVPFLFDGPNEVFWFPLAIGTIAGILFSAIAFVLYLPAFCCGKENKKAK